MPARRQPLRIPSGWTVSYNDGFYEVDPQTDLPIDHPHRWLFTEDMLQLTHAQYDRLLDLGWYPAHDLTNGTYCLVVYAGDYRGHLLAEFRTTDRQVLVAELERLLLEIDRGAL